MSPAQTSFYFREWGKVRQYFTAQGIDPKQADAKRHELHRRALGAMKSSKDFTNADLDKVLAVFYSITRPADLGAQLRIIEQPEERRARTIHLARALVLSMPQIKVAANPEACAANYIDALARRVRGKNFEELDETAMAVIYGILQVRIKPEPEEDGDPF